LTQITDIWLQTGDRNLRSIVFPLFSPPDALSPAEFPVDFELFGSNEGFHFLKPVIQFTKPVPQSAEYV
jgi:hypothetical protein